MYNFMIADDDKLVRDRILSAIPCEELELHLCGTAENGVDALELFDCMRPQIVIMDINMPLINGIDVAKKIIEEDPDVSIIVITGYGTVDFAKEAIREGFADFLLKPVDAEELIQVLKRSIECIRRNTRKALNQQRMERLLEKGMPFLRNRYFLTLMQTPAEQMDEESCEQYLHDFGIVSLPREICIAIVVANYGIVTVNEQMSMQAVLEEEITKILNAHKIGCIIVSDAMQREILITYSTQKLLAFELEQKLSAVRDKMKYLYQIDYHASIGTTVSGFRYLQKSYQSAERALGYWTVLGNGNIVSSENVEHLYISAIKVPAISYGVLMNLMLSGNVEQMCKMLEQYINELLYVSHVTINNLQLRAVEIMAMLLSCARELGENVDEWLEQRTQIYVAIFTATTASSVTRVLQEAAKTLMERTAGQREESTSKAFIDAKRFIMQNYAQEDMNLMRVAEHVNLSPSYVSQLFKKNDNCTFTEYLNTVRIENAKKLLSTTHMRVYEVAEAVGYQNPKYFFQVFKQLTGKRPREFYNAAFIEKNR